MRVLFASWSIFVLLSACPAAAAKLTVKTTTITEWKSVYGQVEARTVVPARARTGGTLIELKVTEGDTVSAGQVLAKVRDDKLTFQVGAADAQLKALHSQLDNAVSERNRGAKLLQSGVTTKQRQEALDTQVEVLTNQIASAEAQRKVLLQQEKEGGISAPLDGRILTVPVTTGSVLMPGETVATVAGGGFFLRLAIPERHAASLKEGAALEIETAESVLKGQLTKIYPEIVNGRVTADVNLVGLQSNFVKARLLVRLPVGTRQALLVPVKSISTRSGIDFIKVYHAEGSSERAIVLGEHAGDKVEVISGLAPGDVVDSP